MRIFISREEERCQELIDWAAENGHEVVAKSLIRLVPTDKTKIQTSPIRHAEPVEAWVLFSSPRAAEIWRDVHGPIPNLKFAALQAGTARRMRDLGYEVSFEGSNASPTECAEEFLAAMKPRSVLLPVGDQSLRSAAKALEGHTEVEELIIYRTEMLPVELPESDVYVFTSPSNARAALGKEGKRERGKDRDTNRGDNSDDDSNVSKSPRIVAWGKSTEKALRELGYECEVLEEPNLEAVIGILG